MKVKELIEILQNEDQEMTVTHQIDDGVYIDISDVKLKRKIKSINCPNEYYDRVNSDNPIKEKILILK